MCGIAGAFSRADLGAAVARMSDALRHRGPDDQGFDVLVALDARPCGVFAHRRLSILDLSPAGHQPMYSADRRYCIVFNGEIYNFRSLRDELRAKGVHFRTESDTEVILEGWARHGARFLDKLRGMYAFALWDRDTNRGYLVRDPFGIKPLYWSDADGSILFASEIRGLLASGLRARAIAREGVAAYLTAGSVPDAASLIDGIHTLGAGTICEVEVNGARAHASEPRPFAVLLEPSANPLERDPQRAARLVRAALADSVAHHLVSDVPVGFFLSGGIDSAALVALASEASEGVLDTFTITFDESDFSEAAIARAVAQRYATRHHEIRLTGRNLLDALPSAFAAMDLPSMDGLNTYVVSDAVSARGLKVAVSGLGGDELFGGYPSFARARRLARHWWWLKPGAASMAAIARRLGTRGSKIASLLAQTSPQAGAYAGSRALFSGDRARALLGPPTPFTPPLPDAPPGLTPLQAISWFELNGYTRQTLLRDSDVFSMAHHLELRVPFLDRRVAEASLAVDDSLKIRGRLGKAVLVDAVCDLLPNEVWDRPKQGFALPFPQWLRGPLKGEVGSALTDAARTETVGLVPSEAAAVWDDFLRGRGVSWSRPWALYTLVRWAEELGLSTDPSAVRNRHSAPLIAAAI